MRGIRQQTRARKSIRELKKCARLLIDNIKTSLGKTFFIGNEAFGSLQ